MAIVRIDAGHTDGDGAPQPGGVDHEVKGGLARDAGAPLTAMCETTPVPVTAPEVHRAAMPIPGGHMRVLVSGATGTTGFHVVRLLHEMGIPVRAMTRSSESAARLRAEGLEAVVADLKDPASLPDALEDISSVYVASPASPHLAEHEANLVRAAAQAGIAHVVKLSVIGVARDTPIAFGRLHFEAEQAIVASGVRWTMIRPNGFMQNTLGWARMLADGTVYGPAMEARWSVVDARDIAAVAVAVLQEPDGHAGETYTVTGPEACSRREQVAVLGEVLGRDISVREVSIAQAQQSMRSAGWPEWNVQGMTEMLELSSDELAQAVSPVVPGITGRAARTFREFARDHLEAFRR